MSKGKRPAHEVIMDGLMLAADTQRDLDAPSRPVDIVAIYIVS